MKSADTVFIAAAGLILAAAFSFCGAASGQTPAAEEGAPKLSVSRAVFDFGTVKEGTQVEAVFPISNSGSAPLEIKKIVSACGCTAAAADSQIIQPGQSSAVKAVFDTDGFQGPKIKTVRIYTNDPAQASFVLTLRGTVQEELIVDPPRVYFGDVMKGSMPSKTVSVLAPADSNLNITDVFARSEALALEVSDVSREGKLGKLLRVTLKDSSQPGVFRAVIVAKTNGKKRPAVTIPVFARIEGSLQLQPSYVSFELLEGPLTQAATAQVELVNNSPQDISIVSLESDNPAVTGSYQAINAGKLYRISLAIAEGTIGTIRARLTITTNHPDASEKTLVLPVYAIISRKGE